MKKRIYYVFLVLTCLLFSSCGMILASMMEKTIGIDEAEYEDETHFYIYFTGTESENGLPDKKSLIVAKNLSDAVEGIESHKIVKIEQNWWDILMGGYLYRCEVSPKFETGETVYVTVRRNTIHKEIGGAAEFVVP